MSIDQVLRQAESEVEKAPLDGALCLRWLVRLLGKESVKCETDADCEALERTCRKLSTCFDTGQVLIQVATENGIEIEDFEKMARIVPELKAADIDDLYIKMTVFVLLDVRSEDFSIEELAHGTSWSIDETIAEKHCRAKVECPAGAVAENASKEQADSIRRTLNLEAARSVKID